MVVVQLETMLRAAGIRIDDLEGRLETSQVAIEALCARIELLEREMTLLKLAGYDR